MSEAVFTLCCNVTIQVIAARACPRPRATEFGVVSECASILIPRKCRHIPATFSILMRVHAGVFLLHSVVALSAPVSYTHLTLPTILLV